MAAACSTPLSNFEAGQNYKEVSDPEVVVSFPLLDDRFAGVSLLAWTTTPWTLPSNLALCVHPDLEYVVVRDAKTQTLYMLAASRIVQMYKKEAEYAVESRHVGRDLEGLKYTPIFDYFVAAKGDTSYRVLLDTYVTDSSGTGVVHQAPPAPPLLPSSPPHPRPSLPSPRATLPHGPCPHSLLTCSRTAR